MKRLLTSFALTYFLCVAVLFTALAVEGLEDARRALINGDVDTVHGGSKAIQAAAQAAVLALFSVPVRLLLGIVPEPSPSSAVRLVRRVLLGAMLAPPPILLMLSVHVDAGTRAGELAGMAALMGGIVGLADAIVRDRDATRTPA